VGMRFSFLTCVIDFLLCWMESVFSFFFPTRAIDLLYVLYRMYVYRRHCTLSLVCVCLVARESQTVSGLG
jgi:hypothetical protein